MLTKTAIKNPFFLARVKSAVIAAVKSAREYAVADTGNGQPGAVRVGFAELAAKRTGKPALLVAWHARTGLEFFDSSDRDVTADVLAALREFHSNQRAALA